MAGQEYASTEGQYSWSAEREKALRRDGFQCQFCGTTDDAHRDQDSGDRGLSVHHIVPRWRGGVDHRENLITVCASCHNLLESLTDQIIGHESRQDPENGIVEQEISEYENYPFYIPADLREELDQLYNRYDGLNKVEGGEGIEKHREFLEPIMRAAISELELEDVVPYEPDE